LFYTKRGLLSRLIRRVSEGVQGVLAAAPLACAACGRNTRSRGELASLCASCRQMTPWITQPKCAVCGRHEECFDCARRRTTHFVCNRSAAHYDARMKSWLAMYKYRGDERMIGLFVDMLSYAYERLALEHDALRGPGGAGENRLITYIPLSEERLRERGFNQAEQFAAGLGRKYNIPVMPLLRRTRHTDKQSYKTRGDRLKDLRGAFAFNQEAWQARSLALEPSPARPSSVPLHIIVVDDVYTTGSTLNECAGVIKSQINAFIYGLTWAR
jgi:competence protein ComFC